jgi:hypothetical protein
MFAQFIMCVLSFWKQYTNYFHSKLIYFSCMLYALCHVQWWPLRVSSLSKKRISSNDCSL